MSAKPQIKLDSTETIFLPKFDIRSEEEAGATLDHNLITNNFGGLLWQHLRGKKCRSFTSDMAVKVNIMKGNEEKYYTYPDVVVACEKAVFSKTKDGKCQIENPTLIVEVLSENSQEDLTTKYEAYQQLESLCEYIVIYQDEDKVHYCVKIEDKWEEKDIQGQDDTLWLSSVGLTIRLGEIYEKCER